MVRRRAEDVGEQVHLHVQLTRLDVRHAGHVSLEAVHDTDRNAAGEKRYRWSQGRTVHRAGTGRAGGEAEGVRAAVALRHAQTELRAGREREVVEGACPTQVEVGSGASDREVDLLGSER